MIWIFDLRSGRIAATAVYLYTGGQRGRIQTQKAQFESWEGRTQYAISINAVLLPLM